MIYQEIPGMQWRKWKTKNSLCFRIIEKKTNVTKFDSFLNLFLIQFMNGMDWSSKKKISPHKAMTYGYF